MKHEYDFANMKSRKNPYAAKLKHQVKIRVRDDVIEYFKELQKDTDIPYSKLMNMYLYDCMAKGKKPDLSWK